MSGAHEMLLASRQSQFGGTAYDCPTAVGVGLVACYWRCIQLLNVSRRTPVSSSESRAIP